ncbi:MAG TPA: carotenoid oxygenase family protein [Gammaproteobacteria bacterium]|nr:carotenoid oxygenase family protein [Gammaproteobacteria bacterium]
MDELVSIGLRDTEASWESTDPYLRDGFAPVHDECDASDLPVSGKLPAELAGVYVRNGPNPAFAPISYTWPFDGDGMLHAVYLESGRARYRNRYVATPGLAAERRAGRAIYGGVAKPFPVAPSLVGPGGDPGPLKNGAFIHVVGHGGRMYAMWEGGTVREITRELETRGEWKPGMSAPFAVAPHTKLDPATGELFLINYALLPPCVQLYVLGPAGGLRRRVDVKLPVATMMHDFVLTERYIVLFHFPLVLDPLAPAKREPFLQWRPELGTRIGLVARDDLAGGVRWIETDPFFAFHFANGFERDGALVVDYVHRPEFVLSRNRQPRASAPAMRRLQIDLAAGTCRSDPISDAATEFPRINESFATRASRWVYAPVRRGPAAADGEAPVYRGIAKFDCENGNTMVFDLGGDEIGEAVFVPRANASVEDDGWLMAYVYRPRERASDFCVFDARALDAGPLASVRLPRRVPHGLHGNWFPA